VKPVGLAAPAEWRSQSLKVAPIRSRIQNVVELDQSLRRSRAVYILLSAIFVPGAVLATFWFVFLALDVAEGRVALRIGTLIEAALCVVEFLLAYSFVSSAREAARRLRRLAENPDADVRPMPVSFLETLFNLR